MNRTPGEETTFKLYEILGVDPCCTEEQLKRAYHKKALKIHPDKTGGREQASFIALKDGYALLKDPLVRKFYNRHGDQGIENFKKAGEKSYNLLDSTKFISRMVLRVSTHPTGLIPVSCIIGFMFLSILLFFWFLDWKLDGWSWSWTIVFSWLWFSLAVFSVLLIAFNVMAFIAARSAFSSSPEQVAATFAEDKKTIERFAMSLIFGCLKVDLWMGSLIWFSISLHRALIENQPSVNWTVWPFAWAAYIVTVLNFIQFFMSLKFLNSVRSRQLKLLSILANGFQVCVFFTVLAVGANNTLLALTGVLVVAAIFGSNYISYLKYDEDLRISVIKFERRTIDPIEARRLKENLMNGFKRFKILRWMVTAFVVFQVLFLFTHLLLGFPRTWTWTAISIVISVFIQSVTFLILIPLILWAMDRLLPDVSEKTLSELQTGASEECVVIDLPAKTIYSFGYVFGRFQPRLKSK